MNILQLIYALEIAKHKSISKAAEALYVSQPAVSHQIQNLEKELCVPLFKRTSHGVKLTDAGEIFCQKAADVIAPWNELQKTMTRYNKNSMESSAISLNIWLGTIVRSNNYFEQIVEFFDKRPGIDAHFLSDMGGTINSYEALSKKEIDIAIDRIPPAYMASDIENYYIADIFHEKAHVLIRRTHPLADRLSITAEDLIPYSPITFDRDSVLNNIQKDVYNKLGVRFQDDERCRDISEAMDLIRSGRRYGIGSPSIAQVNQILAVPFSPEFQIPFSFICLKENKNRAEFRMFLRHLRKLAEKE